MGIGSTLEECLLKSVRSLEIGVCHLYMPKFDDMEIDEIKEYIKEFRDDNIYAIAQLIRKGVTIEELHDITKITAYFLETIKKIVDFEKVIKENKGDLNTLKQAKIMGFSDKFIAKLWETSEISIFEVRKNR